MKLSISAVTDSLGLTRSQNEPEKIIVDPSELGEKKVLLSWESLSRPNQTEMSGNKLSRTFTVIGVVIAFFLIILQEFFLLLVIGSIIFVSYVLSKVPPENIKYTISTHGVSIGDTVYYWQELRDFFFMEHGDRNVFVVDVRGGTFPRLYLTYLPHNKDEIKNILSQHILYLEHEPKSVIDKTYENLMSKLTTK